MFNTIVTTYKKKFNTNYTTFKRSSNKTLNDTNKILQLHQSPHSVIWSSIKFCGHQKIKSYKLKHNNIRHKQVHIKMCLI